LTCIKYNRKDREDTAFFTTTRIGLALAWPPGQRTMGQMGETDANAGAPVGPVAIAALDRDTAPGAFGSSAAGLSPDEAQARLLRYGRNIVAAQRTAHPLSLLLSGFARPLPLLLLALAALDLGTGQAISAAVIAAIVVLSCLLGFAQEYRSQRAVERLRALVRTDVQVLRRPADGKGEGAPRACPLEELVPGDIVALSAGDLVPADLRFLDTVDLFVDQSALTGEALPVEKHSRPAAGDAPLELANLGFMGTHVTSGSARALVIATGAATSFGQLAGALAEARERTDFDRGIDRVVALLLRFMLVMAPLVLVLNWATKGDFHQALLFASAVAVGLAPEMLPMIVTVNLARGALVLSERGVIVKRLGAVQSLGAIDVLCADKTGTLTQDRVVLERHVDIAGKESERVLDYAYLNSYHQTGLRNLLDAAVLRHGHVHARLAAERDWRKVGEVPFDFERRRMSVVLERPGGERVLICKGAVEEITSVCASAELDGNRIGFGSGHAATLGGVVERLNASGLRVIAIAFRLLEPGETCLTDPALERGLVLLGYTAFFDPPKESAAPAIRALATRGVAVKVLSGDNAAVCAHVCGLVGIDAQSTLTGAEVERLDDAALGAAAAATTVFAKLAPQQKTRVIRALQGQGRVVGFLGDGINDGPALRCADVGISVDTGADIARESADLILLQKSLVAVDDGVLAGRTVFGNIVKYIRMSASSNFGNMLSVLGAGVLLPFLPMAPLQVLLNTLLYDCSQTALTADRVDPGYLALPRRWEVDSIRRYVLCFGPVSSLFDYATFALLWFGLGAWANVALFQTGWFVESLLSQTLIVYVIRTEMGAGATRPAAALVAASLLVCAAGLWLPLSPLAPLLGMVPLPAAYWWGLAAILAAYAGLTLFVKCWLSRRFGIG
jgi:Mg2+-importing ATPase